MSEPCPICRQPIPFKGFVPHYSRKGKEYCAGCGRSIGFKPAGKQNTGLVCGNCGDLYIYWDETLNSPEVWIQELKESMPMACRNCGVGEYKIVSNIKLSAWCDECNLPKKKCRCKVASFGDF
jgi:uncharacterized protein (DUF983 family)